MDEKHLLGQCTFTPSRNEVEFLDKRLKGVRIVLLKKYCMDLPEKMYDVVIAKPSVATLRVAKMIRKTATRAVTILGKLRELSDGFQYKEVPDGKITCPLCDGSGKYFSPGGDGEDIDPDNLSSSIMKRILMRKSTVQVAEGQAKSPSINVWRKE
jgi:hypothetical protein